MSRRIVLPARTLVTPALMRGGRPVQLLKLAGTMAPADGIYSAGGSVARLKKGEALLSLTDLTELWGIARTPARKALDAFTREGIITVSDEIERCYVEGERQPRGRLIRFMYS